MLQSKRCQAFGLAIANPKNQPLLGAREIALEQARLSAENINPFERCVGNRQPRAKRFIGSSQDQSLEKWQARTFQDRRAAVPGPAYELTTTIGRGDSDMM